MAKKLSIISFSEHGFKFQKAIRSDIEQFSALYDMELDWYCKDKSGFWEDGFVPVLGPTKEWSADRFEDSEIIVFICTVAKAVRNFAPSMKGQTSDPAVVVIDQHGKFAVPVLAGKQGEAYDLCLWLEDKVGLTSVNSVSKDTDTGFSVVKFAENNNMIISNDNYAKEIMAAIDSGEKIGFTTTFPVKGELPEGMDWSEKGPLGINLSFSYHNAYFQHTLWLIPKCVEIGIKLTDDITPKDLSNFVGDILKELSIYTESINSISVMNCENVNLAEMLCASYDCALNVYTEDDLAQIKAAFPEKAYYECAAIRSGEAKVITRSVSPQGVEVAVALRKVYIEF